MDNSIEKLTYDVEDLMGVLGISRVKAYELANSQGFPKIRIGKRILIPKESLLKWLQEESAK